ncbi:hypothetical protein ACU4GD_44860 [Cupriavidus basilensis]
MLAPRRRPARNLAATVTATSAAAMAGCARRGGAGARCAPA